MLRGLIRATGATVASSTSYSGTPTKTLSGWKVISTRTSTSVRAIPERGNGLALAEQASAGLRSFFRKKRDPPERRHDLDVVDRRAGDLDAIGLVIPGARGLDPGLADRDRVVDQPGVKRLLEASHGAAREQHRQEETEHRVRHREASVAHTAVGHGLLGRCSAGLGSRRPDSESYGR